ncbi:hypothetical protein FRC07_002133 [Ceratobasidium sp. 392]|nr:hypothetical protein FRC07_002133 [Ceratobasidium sp. 392]
MDQPTHILISSTTSSPGAWALEPSHSNTPQFQAVLPRSGAPVLHIDSLPACRDKLRARREGLLSHLPIDPCLLPHSANAAAHLLDPLNRHLLDATCLTAAVGSPSKANVCCRDAQVGMPASELDNNCTMTNTQLEPLSDCLRELEQKNGTVRRRVRELEMEPEHCKAEVEREKI